MADLSACANAEPLSRLEQLERENANFRTWGIIEVAIRNPNVAEYMAHWEARTQKAEAENEALRTKLETVEAETRERIAAALDEEVDLIPCAEDAMVTRSNARLVRANFSYEDAERLEVEEDQAIRNLEPRQ